MSNKVWGWHVQILESGAIVKTRKMLSVPTKPIKKHDDDTIDLKEAFTKIQNKVIEPAKNMLEKIYKTEKQEFETYKITPTPSIRNNQTYILAKIMASFYEKSSERTKYFQNGTLITEREQYRCNFRIVFKPGDIGFYFILPTEKANEILRKIESVYDSGITIEKVVEGLPKLDAKKTFCTNLSYRRHNIFSLDTNKSNNYPLPSLLTPVRSLEKGDIAIMDIMLEPYSRDLWEKEAKDAHALLKKGYMPNGQIKNVILRTLHQGFLQTSYKILEMTRFSKEELKQLQEQRDNDFAFLEAQRVRREMQPVTKQKIEQHVLNTWMRIAVQSDELFRAKDIAHTIANSWKDISSDNEILREDVPAHLNDKFLDAIENRKRVPVKRLPTLYSPNRLSVDEVGKLLQLPGETLIKDFPEIHARITKEVNLPDELTRTDVKYVRIGNVTERGVTKLARLPVEAYDNISQDAVYDALCTTNFTQGKSGTGKSEGCGTNWAYDMMKAGFTTIIMDTADGEVLRKYIDSLPADYPDGKIHVLNFDNKAYPIPLNWSDIYGREIKVDDDTELEHLEISERMTSRFIEFVNSLSNTGEFSDRMRQYLSSCMRAVTKTKNWSFLDVELALSSPTYREELLALEAVQSELDIVRDLETLQMKAQNGKQGEIIDNIMNRLAVLSSSTFLSNLFLQPPKLDENEKPVLDLRKLMDNEEGGYGHTIVIQASGLWENNQAIILGFMEDRINFNAFSRIDIPQNQRKPVLKWIDEPHKVIKQMEDRLAGTNVEFRKYRVKNLFTGHSIDQMGKATKSLLEGGAQITSYKTESIADLERFKHMFAPYDNAEQLYAALNDKHHAINKVRLPSGKNSPAFLAHMIAPPSHVKDRSQIWHESAKKYGRPWKEVKNDIQEKRIKYREMDIEWLEENAPKPKKATK